ncbi:MAG: Rrf2 family transcriptional regulator [Planctomycetes bacterium]|nr:Rrf2 family transcriptional regulator [Planctomycetota bacterium]
MQVTRAVDYGLRALVLMSHKPVGERHYLQELAEGGNLPRNYLVKVLKSLACANIVRSHRGIKGGFSLAREPKEISLRVVVEAIDGPLSVMHCLTDPRSCSEVGACAIEVLFTRLRTSIVDYLGSNSLQDLLDLQSKIDKGEGCPVVENALAACCETPAKRKK